jgi:hypothetical protein
MAQQTIQVTTAYGWGWVIDGESCFRVPEPFSARLDSFEETRWAGIVVNSTVSETLCRSDT